MSRWSGVLTTRADISSSRSVLTIEECASRDTTRSFRPAASSPSRLFAVSRLQQVQRDCRRSHLTRSSRLSTRQARLVGNDPSTVFCGDRSRGFQPGDALDGCAGDQHVEQQAGLGWSCGNEAEEARAVRGDDAGAITEE